MTEIRPYAKLSIRPKTCSSAPRLSSLHARPWTCGLENRSEIAITNGRSSASALPLLERPFATSELPHELIVSLLPAAFVSTRHSAYHSAICLDQRLNKLTFDFNFVILINYDLTIFRFRQRDAFVIKATRNLFAKN
jgi:hypothetical protein